jgi:hypothetical protein
MIVQLGLIVSHNPVDYNKTIYTEVIIIPDYKKSKEAIDIIILKTFNILEMSKLLTVISDLNMPLDAMLQTFLLPLMIGLYMHNNKSNEIMNIHKEEIDTIIRQVKAL